MIALSAQQHAIVAAIVKAHLGSRSVKVFGSRACGAAKPFSDLDLLVQGEPLSASERGAIEEAFDESDLPFRVDMVEAASTASTFLQHIEPQLRALS